HPYRVTNGADHVRRDGRCGMTGGLITRAAPPTRAGTLLPASKVTIPAPPEWMIARPRLIDRLAKGTRSALTVVVGPPGAGKTVAVAAWARSDRTPGPVAWVTLDPGDDRPDVFWPLLREGLERAGLAVPGAG